MSGKEKQSKLMYLSERGKVIYFDVQKLQGWYLIQMLHLHGDGSDDDGCHSDGVKSNYQ